MSEAFIKKLIVGFESGTLDDGEWDHKAHLIVCLYYLHNLPFFEATLKIKTGIINFNKASGIQNSLERGYHETLTLFWIWAVESFCVKQNNNNLELVDLVNQLLITPYSKKYLPFFFYSEDLLFSSKARITWVEPDLKKLNPELIEAEYPRSIWYG